MATTTKDNQQAAQKLAVAKALADPLREKVFTRLTEAEASATQMARELDEPPHRMAYAFKVLRDLGCIEHVATKPVKGTGATENFFKAVARPHIDLEEWKEEHSALGDHFAWRPAALVFEDLAKAIDAGLLVAIDDIHMGRTPLHLDSEGRREIFELHDETLDRTLEIQARSDQRRSRSGEEGRHLCSAQLCFETMTGSAPPID
jgi:hypothetical protein